MNNKNENFISLLDDLCQMYKSYVNKHIGSKIEVLIDTDFIDIRLVDGELIDDFRLRFNSKEENQCLKISVILLKLLFNRHILFNEGNKIYNEKRSYLDVFVLDDDMLNKILSITMNDKNTDGYRYVNLINKKSTVKALEERVYLSRKLLRMDDRI